MTPTEVHSFLGLAGYYRRFVEVCKHSFQELKGGWISAPVLALLEGSEGYAVYCDSFVIGLGCALMQCGKVIIYVSRKLRKNGKNYLTYDSKDHKSLQHIFRHNELNLRHHR
ncbi:hypothetical protein MTR67_018277 [Solanum verrucosum]|uniref:Reverse transcriptase/retrotransposon-derived protein RNase H-like domain-containing protein n=1 Tax=Solanum verrucosum TaxID=315347 RepID=A0AAF0TLG2_SOLVR|nr:hypothetical protein MTR67_018277 [Solanum verrucosum]